MYHIRFVTYEGTKVLVRDSLKSALKVAKYTYNKSTDVVGCVVYDIVTRHVFFRGGFV